MADWNPKTDPYYASLYDQTPFDFIDSYRKSEQYLQQQEQNDLQNETDQLKIQNERDRLSQKTALSEALKQGGDYREKARQIYIENGDIENLTKLDKDIVEEKYKNILADKQELENILNLPPDVAMERYNSGRLGQSGPKVTNMNDLYKANRKLQGSVAGGIFSQDPMTGEPIIHTGPQYKPDSSANSGMDKAAPSQYVDMMGNLQYVNLRDPQERALALQEGWVPYSQTESTLRREKAKADEKAYLDSQKVDEPNAFMSWVNNLGKTTPPPQQPIPNDNSLNGAYKGQGPIKNGVVTLRKKPEFNKGIGQQ
jgi:hypothetical protein